MTHLIKCVSFSLILISLMGFVMVSAVFMVGVARGEEIVIATEEVVPAEERVMEVDVYEAVSAAEEFFTELSSGSKFKFRKDILEQDKINVEYRDRYGVDTIEHFNEYGMWEEKVLDDTAVRAKIDIVLVEERAYVEGPSTTAVINLRQGGLKSLGGLPVLEATDKQDPRFMERGSMTHTIDIAIAPSQTLEDVRVGDVVEWYDPARGLQRATANLVGKDMEFLYEDGTRQALGRLGAAEVFTRMAVTLRNIAREMVIRGAKGAMIRQYTIVFCRNATDLALLPSRAQAAENRQKGIEIIFPPRPMEKGRIPEIVKGEKVKILAMVMRGGAMKELYALQDVVWEAAAPPGVINILGMAPLKEALVEGKAFGWGGTIAKVARERSGIGLGHLRWIKVIDPPLQDVIDAREKTRYMHPPIGLTIDRIDPSGKAIDFTVHGADGAILASEFGFSADRGTYHRQLAGGYDFVMEVVDTSMAPHPFSGAAEPRTSLRINDDLAKERTATSLKISTTPLVSAGKSAAVSTMLLDQDGLDMGALAEEFDFTSSNASLATFDALGMVRALAKGPVVLKARHKLSGLEATKSLKVVP